MVVKAERFLPDLVSRVREDYGKRTTYHDGKWMFVNVDGAKVLSDIKKLLTLKRQPKPGQLRSFAATVAIGSASDQ